MKIFFLVFFMSIVNGVFAQTQADLDSLLNTANTPKKFSQTDIELARRRCKTNNDSGTFLAADGTIWQVCLYGQKWENGQCIGLPKAVTWYEAMDVAKNSNFDDKNDWILPSSVFLNGSIHPQSCNHPNIKTYVQDNRHLKSLRIAGNFWTAKTGNRDGGDTVQIVDDDYISGYGSVLYDTMKSANHFDKIFTKPVYVALVRNAPSEDTKQFTNALRFAQCDSNCIESRKYAQRIRDSARAQSGEEWRANVVDFFKGGSSSSISSSDPAGKWEIISQGDGGGLAHWYVKKYNMICNRGNKSGATFTVYHLKSGGYQELSWPRRNSLAEAATDGCP